MVHVGIGYDVNALVAGRKLILGGVNHMISGRLFVAGGALVCDGVAGALAAGATGGLRKRLKFVTPKTVSWFVLSSTISGLSL